MKNLNVGILLFDDVEVLDFAGPFEVFSRTRPLLEDATMLDWIRDAAGIDMAFAVVESLHGAEVANETARYIDFPRSRAPA